MFARTTENKTQQTPINSSRPTGKPPTRMLPTLTPARLSPVNGDQMDPKKVRFFGESSRAQDKANMRQRLPSSARGLSTSKSVPTLT